MVSNSIDEIAAGHGSTVRVQVDGDTLLVSDDGRGFPFGDSTPGRPSAAEVVLTSLHTGATADGHTPHVHLQGLRGLGIAVAHALCEELLIEATRDGVAWKARCSRGKILEMVSLGPSDLVGTKVTMRADPQIFKETTHWPAEALRHRLLDIAHLLPGITVELGDERFCPPEGLADRLRLVESTSELGPVFWLRDRVEDVVVEVAARDTSWPSRGYQPGYPETVLSWCNGSRTREHGTHVDGVLAACSALGWWPAQIAVSVMFHNPRYSGPTCGHLNVPHLRTLLAETLREPLTAFVDEHIDERR